MTETGAERETLFRNLSITKSVARLPKAARSFSKMNWRLRVTNASADPVITADTPVIVEGQAPTLEAAMEDPRTLLFFPLCWRACLVGSPTKFDVETDSFHACDLRRLRSGTFEWKPVLRIRRSDPPNYCSACFGRMTYYSDRRLKAGVRTPPLPQEGASSVPPSRSGRDGTPRPEGDE